MQEYINESAITNQNKALAAGLSSVRNHQGEAQAASGTIKWSGNFAAGDTVTINGVVFTAVASGASGNQWNIAGSLSLSIDALVTVLNASVDALVSPATYSKVSTDTLKIVHDTLSAVGNSFSIKASSPSNTVTIPERYLTGGAGAEVIAFPIKTKVINLVATGGSNVPVVLPAGLDGQEVVLFLKTKGGAGNVVVTPSSIAGGATLTFSAVGKLAHLIYLGGTWNVLANTATLA